MKLKLYLIRETDKARLYTELPPERNPELSDMFWVPRSVIEHCTKFGNEHHVTISDWFAEREDL